jgi:hypothetical protein
MSRKLFGLPGATPNRPFFQTRSPVTRSVAETAPTDTDTVIEGTALPPGAHALPSTMTSARGL